MEPINATCVYSPIFNSLFVAALSNMKFFHSTLFTEYLKYY